jgi:tetratricopeptide (TPR) repeat protein
LQAAIALDPAERAGVVQPGAGAACGQRSWSRRWKSFQQAVKLDPRDADSYYFEGVCYQEMKEFDKAIAIFKQALKIDPLHASSGVCHGAGAAAVGQHAGGEGALQAFQHLTSTKIGAPIGLAYGEQGHYSTVTPVRSRSGMKAMIPVKLVATPLPRSQKLTWGTRAHSRQPAGLA